MLAPSDRSTRNSCWPVLGYGRWFGDRNDTFHAGARTAWDAFTLFHADATFATIAAHLETSVRTILGQPRFVGRRVDVRAAYDPGVDEGEAGERTLRRHLPTAPGRSGPGR